MAQDVGWGIKRVRVNYHSDDIYARLDPDGVFVVELQYNRGNERNKPRGKHYLYLTRQVATELRDKLSVVLENNSLLP